jgi:hypothetical protein
VPVDSVGILDGVSCTAADACTAVGYNIWQVSAEVWNGTSWTNQSSDFDAVAAGVSCATTDACEAVGSTPGIPPLFTTFSAGWNGASWVGGSAANPPETEVATLADVSCPAASTCEAVGSYTNSSGDVVPLAEMLSGSSWTIQSTPDT